MNQEICKAMDWALGDTGGLKEDHGRVGKTKNASSGKETKCRKINVRKGNY